MAILRGFPPSNKISPGRIRPLVERPQENPDQVFCHNPWTTRSNQRLYLEGWVRTAHRLSEVPLTTASQAACMEIGWKVYQFFAKTAGWTGWREEEGKEIFHNEDIGIVHMMEILNPSEAWAYLLGRWDRPYIAEANWAILMRERLENAF